MFSSVARVTSRNCLRAMESYIQQKMKMKINGAANTDNEPSEAIARIKKPPSTGFAVTLSRELTAAVISMVGKSENTVMLDASGRQHCRSHFSG
jgi:type 1 fimbria pilin